MSALDYGRVLIRREWVRKGYQVVIPHTNAAMVDQAQDLAPQKPGANYRRKAKGTYPRFPRRGKVKDSPRGVNRRAAVSIMDPPFFCRCQGKEWSGGKGEVRACALQQPETSLRKGLLRLSVVTLCEMVS